LALDENIAIFISNSYTTGSAPSTIIGVEGTRESGRRGSGIWIRKANRSLFEDGETEITSKDITILKKNNNRN